MRPNLIELLACPACKGELELKPLEEENGKIKSGILTCACGGVYPVIDFIPRVYNSAPLEHSDFFSKNEIQISKQAGRTFDKIDNRARLFAPGYQQVQTQFNMQWDKFADNEKIFGKNKEQILAYLENFMMYPDKDVSSIKGKTVLDAGCGHGLYTWNLAENDVNIVGLDITNAAVYKTYSRVKDFPNAHVIQGDALHAPFKPEVFDFVFSEGVIHHTPNTRMTFHRLSHTVKHGGEFSIWVYPVRSWAFETVQSFLRKVTTRLPSKFLYYLCFIPVPLLSIFKAYSGTSLKSASWNECAQVVWDFYSPQYQTHHPKEEVRQWFLEEGYKDVHFSKDPVGAIGTRL